MILSDWRWSNLRVYMDLGAGAAFGTVQFRTDARLSVLDGWTMASGRACLPGVTAWVRHRAVSK
jgi:hypothetical protein